MTWWLKGRRAQMNRGAPSNVLAHFDSPPPFKDAKRPVSKRGPALFSRPQCPGLRTSMRFDRLFCAAHLSQIPSKKPPPGFLSNVERFFFGLKVRSSDMINVPKNKLTNKFVDKAGLGVFPNHQTT